MKIRLSALLLMMTVWSLSFGQKLEGFYYRDLDTYKWPKTYPTPGGDGYDNYVARNFNNNRAICAVYSTRLVVDTNSADGYMRTPQTVIHGVIDTAGNIIADFKYDFIQYRFYQKPVRYGPEVPLFFQRGDTIGLLDYNGKEIYAIPATYSDRFCDSIGKEGMENDYYMQHAQELSPRYGSGYGQRPEEKLQGDLISQCRKQKNQIVGYTDLKWIQVKIDEKYGLINRITGETVVPVICDQIKMVSPQIAVIQIGKDAVVYDLVKGEKSVYPGKEVYLSSDSTYFIVSHDGREIDYYPESKAAGLEWVSVLPNGGYHAPAIFRSASGYGVWEEGKITVPAQYDDIYILAPNYYWVKQNDRWAIAESLGSFRLLTPFSYRDVDKMNDVYVQNLLYISNADTSALDSDTTESGWRMSEDQKKYRQIISETLELHKQKYRKYYFTNYPGLDKTYLLFYGLADSGYNRMFISPGDSSYVSTSKEYWDNIFMVPYPAGTRNYQKGKVFYTGTYKCNNLIYNPTAMKIMIVKRRHVYTQRYRGGHSGRSIFTGEHFSYHTGKYKWRRAGRYRQKYRPAPPPEKILH